VILGKLRITEEEDHLDSGISTDWENLRNLEIQVRLFSDEDTWILGFQRFGHPKNLEIEVSFSRESNVTGGIPGGGDVCIDGHGQERSWR
jgi:hypothetical protein